MGGRAGSAVIHSFMSPYNSTNGTSTSLLVHQQDIVLTDIRQARAGRDRNRSMERAIGPEYFVHVVVMASGVYPFPPHPYPDVPNTVDGEFPAPHASVAAAGRGARHRKE